MGTLIGFMTAFGLCQYISYIIELKTLGSAEMTVLWQLTHPLAGRSINVVNFPFVVLDAAWDWIKNILNLVFWNYAFFDGWLVIVQYLIFIPISIGLIWTLISMLRGTSSS